MLGEKHLLEARERAMMLRPWYGPFLARFVFVKRESKQPLYHDQYGRVYYNDGYASFAKVEMLTVLLIQIAEMFTRGYHWRRMGRDPYLWSFACLLETSSSLLKQGFELPRESLKPGWFHLAADKTAEWYYRELERMFENSKRLKLPFTALDKRGRPMTLDVECFFEDGKLQFTIPEAAVVGGFASPEDMLGAVSEFLLDPLLFSGLQEEVFDLAGEFKEQRPGDMPDWLLRRAEADQSTLPWHQYLRLFLGDHFRIGSASRASTFTLPSLLAPVLPPGMVLPYYQGRSPSLALVIDTSGSMSQQHLGTCLGEVNAVLRTLEADNGIIVIPCDASAKTVQKVFAASQLQLEGGGGTEIGKGLEKATELTPPPEAVIVLTDGYTSWPKEPPGRMQVLVIIVSEQWSKPEEKKKYPTPSWAHVVEMFPWKGGKAA